MPHAHTPRAVLIAGPCLAGVIGMAYTFGDDSRTQSTSFDAAKQLASMQTWGLFFLGGAAALILALISGSMRLLAAAWFVGGAMYAWWASCFALQALSDSHASLDGWALYAVVAMVHFIVAARCWTRRAAR